ncbi:MAG: hypothetical protein K2J11_05465 [Oscillospiraceae bacterium]|nr:hypothetical protein [Oscillospiraceae bacterium]
MSAPPRNAFAFLTPFTVLNDMRLRAQEGDFAVCGRRPKGSALWKLATFEKVDETFPCGFAARGLLVSALNQNLQQNGRQMHRHSPSQKIY